MHILIVQNSIIPVEFYGGTERVVWYLGKTLAELGHKVSYLARQGSSCPFAKVYNIDQNQTLAQQIPDGIDIVHIHGGVPKGNGQMKTPYIITIHGNISDKNYDKPLDLNSVFVSKNHAARHGSSSFVYNGMDWNDYGTPDWNVRREYVHFLGKAAWRVKNVKGAIKVVTSVPHERLFVLGGYRLNFKMGFRLTLSSRVKFFGMVGGSQKLSLLQGSKGLIFPVRWHEPFGLALTESLYFGCPVLGTPYGSLPEIIHPEVGYLSAKSSELSAALKEIGQYSPKRCHEYARDCFNAKAMAMAYLEKYSAVLNNKPLNNTPPKLLQQNATRNLAWE